MRFCILVVGNKRYPAADYRVRLGEWLVDVRIKFVLPGRPIGVLEKDWHEIGFGEGVRPHDVLNWLALARYLRQARRECDVVHFFSTQLTLFGPMLGWLLGHRTWVTITGFGRIFVDDGWLYRWLRLFYRGCFSLSSRCAEKIFFQNHGDMRTAAEWLPSRAAKFEWIGSAMDLPVYPVKKSSKGPLRVLMVSRLLPSKGIDLFLEIIESVFHKDIEKSGIEFTLVGPPSKGEEKLRRSVETAVACGKLSWLGELGGRQLESVYKAHHVLLFPSRGEGMARVMIEAAFYGLCPVASNIPANEELVGNDRGVLFAAERPDMAAASLLALCRNHENMLAMAARYQNYVTAQYGMKAFSERIGRAIASF